MSTMENGLFVVRRTWRQGGLVTIGKSAPLEWAPQPAAVVEPVRRPWSGGHKIDLRASIPLPGGRWYVTILAGRERRSADRLVQEGQTNLFRRAAVYMLMMSALLWLIVCVLVLAYLLKSALGLDFMEDASPLHFIYERFFESRRTQPFQDVANALPAASIAFTMFA